MKTLGVAGRAADSSAAPGPDVLIAGRAPGTPERRASRIARKSEADPKAKAQPRTKPSGWKAPLRTRESSSPMKTMGASPLKAPPPLNREAMVVACPVAGATQTCRRAPRLSIGSRHAEFPSPFLWCEEHSNCFLRAHSIPTPPSRPRRLRTGRPAARTYGRVRGGLVEAHPRIERVLNRFSVSLLELHAIAHHLGQSLVQICLERHLPSPRVVLDHGELRPITSFPVERPARPLPRWNSDLTRRTTSRRPCRRGRCAPPASRAWSAEGLSGQPRAAGVTFATTAARVVARAAMAAAMPRRGSTCIAATAFASCRPQRSNCPLISRPPLPLLGGFYRSADELDQLTFSRSHTDDRWRAVADAPSRMRQSILGPNTR